MNPLQCKHTDSSYDENLLFKFVTQLLLVIDKVKISETDGEYLKKIIVSRLFDLAWKINEKKNPSYKLHNHKIFS